MGPTHSPIKLQEAQHQLCRSGLGIQQSGGADFPDEEHSVEESLEIIIGHSAAKPLLLVCFTERETDRIRIISARRATRAEQHDYEEHVAK
jgi:uncharacterized DUF497 family protein